MLESLLLLGEVFSFANCRISKISCQTRPSGKSQPGIPVKRTPFQAEIRTTFEQGWEVEAISASRFEVVDACGGAEAWLASIRLLPALLRD
jgi:hypothetical protein